MPKVFKEGWEYYYSEILKQEIALHLATGRVYCADGVQYSQDELAILNKSGAEISQGVHWVKSLFRGTVVGLTENKSES